MTAYSLVKLSLVQRISPETRRRPTVRLSPRNSSVPRIAKLTDRRSTAPDDASPNEIAMMIQPLESSRIADATMIWPTSRRMKFISRTTMATILIDEIDSAVARNSAVTKRDCGSGRIESGSISPSAKPQMNGSVTPAAATAMAARPTRRTSRRSVSIPVSSKQHQDAELRDGIDHALLLDGLRKQRVRSVGPEQTEHRRPEQNAAEELSHDRRLAELLHDFAKAAADQQQDCQLGDKDGLGGAGAIWRRQRKATETAPSKTTKAGMARRASASGAAAHRARLRLRGGCSASLPR